MSESELVVYIGPFAFPDGGAAARRILGTARAIRSGGFDVIIGSGQEPITSSILEDTYDGFRVFSLGERTAEHLITPLKYAAYASMGNKTVSWLDSLQRKPKALILYSGYLPYFIRLLPWCRKNQVPLIFDAVEWYTPDRWIEWIYNPYFWSSELTMRWSSIRAGNAITISRRLFEHYLKRDCVVELIPPTVSIDEYYVGPGNPSGRKLTLVYAGSPGTKDLLNVVIDVALDLDPFGEKIVLNIVGPTEREIGSHNGVLQSSRNGCPSCINFLGPVSHRDALDVVRNSDFSVLLRRPNRVAMAGFPTKVVESLAVGTPVIANFTSDLRVHLADGVNALIVPGFDQDACKGVIKKALSLSVQERAEMRREAYLHATRAFDADVYSENLVHLLGRASSPMAWTE